jgi:hypothetical protein
MVLSDESISVFQELFKKRFGYEISKKEALERGLKLIEFVGLIEGIPMDRGDTKMSNNQDQ